MKRSASLELEHPALDTFERVLNNGVVVERGPEARRRRTWPAATADDADWLDAESSTEPRPGHERGTAKRRVRH